MSKLTLINPLAVLGARYGYNRPLDRHDWDGRGGHVPSWAASTYPTVGELKRFANLTNMQGDNAVGQDMYTTDTTQRHPLGTLASTKDGRLFRYATAGGVACVVGSLYQSAVPIADHLARTATAQQIGDGIAQQIGGVTFVPVTFTPAATGGAANLYAEGTIMVSTTPDLGHSYRISGHGTITSSVAFNLFLDPDDRIQVAWTTATKTGLHHNPYKNILVCPTTITAKVVGVAVSLIAANTVAQNYGWIQTRGACAVLINGTPAVTAPVINSATTIGAVDVWTAGAQPTSNWVGEMMQLGVSTECDAVFLQID